jgi:hypothetical protein
MPEGPFRYTSAHTSVPLNELEEALLVGAGAGFSGLASWDLPTPPPYRSAVDVRIGVTHYGWG